MHKAVDTSCQSDEGSSRSSQGWGLQSADSTFSATECWKADSQSHLSIQEQGRMHFKGEMGIDCLISIENTWLTAGSQVWAREADIWQPICPDIFFQIAKAQAIHAAESGESMVECARYGHRPHCHCNYPMQASTGILTTYCCIVKGVLDLPEGQDVIVIGTLYKDMKLKPSILSEYSKVSNSADTSCLDPCSIWSCSVLLVGPEEDWPCNFTTRVSCHAWPQLSWVIALAFARRQPRCPPVCCPDW